MEFHISQNRHVESSPFHLFFSRLRSIAKFLCHADNSLVTASRSGMCHLVRLGSQWNDAIKSTQIEPKPIRTHTNHEFAIKICILFRGWNSAEFRLIVVYNNMSCHVDTMRSFNQKEGANWQWVKWGDFGHSWMGILSRWSLHFDDKFPAIFSIFQCHFNVI